MTAPTAVTSIVTAGANGTKVESVRFIGVATTVAGLINIFRYDGTTYHLIDQVSVSAVTVSSTAASWLLERIYPNLWLQSGDSLRVSNMVAGNASNVKVTAFASNF